MPNSNQKFIIETLMEESKPSLQRKNNLDIQIN